MVTRWRVVLVSQFPQGMLALDAAVRDAGHTAVAVFAARGKGLHPREPFNAVLSELIHTIPVGLPVVFPGGPEQIASLLDPFEPDLLLCYGFPWRIPVDALAVPRLGGVNVHPSLLPRYRGPTPIAWAIRNADPEVGLSLHRMDADFDTGPLLAQGRVPLDDDDSIATLQPKLAALLEELLPHALECVAAGDPGVSQEDGDGVWAGSFGDDYVWIDPGRTTREVHAQVRAWRFPMPPVPLRGALLELDGRTVRVLGTSLRRIDGPRIECADGPLWIVESEPVEPPAT